MDQDSELDALLPRRDSFDAMRRARLDASQGRGKPVEANDQNRMIAAGLAETGDDIGRLERVGTEWRIITAVDAPTYGDKPIWVEFPLMPTVAEALEEAIQTTSGYLWLLALGRDDFVFHGDGEDGAAPSDLSEDIPF